MIASAMKRVLRGEMLILLLSLTALACLPIALSEIVRDAARSLLLPVTLFAALLAYGLNALSVKKIPVGIFLFVLVISGPLILFVRIGSMGSALFETIKQTFLLAPASVAWLMDRTPVELSSLILARDTLLTHTLTLTDRLALWFTGIWFGIHVEDPVARTFTWGAGLWLVNVWAGWQIFRHGRLLAGLLPCTVILALVLDYTGKGYGAFWVHFSALLTLTGLTSIDKLVRHWKSTHTDYSDSATQDTLVIVGALTLGLLAASFLASSISVSDILEKLRESQTASDTSRAESLGLEAKQEDHGIGRLSSGGLPRSHLLGSGPELSRRVVMTITTGDLPKMPPNARPNIPRYYWRTLTYEFYIGSGWANPSIPETDVPADEALTESAPAKYRVVNQEVTFSEASDGRLYWTGVLVSANTPVRAAWRNRADTSIRDPFEGADLIGALSSENTYRAKSLLSRASGDDLRSASIRYPEWVQAHYLKLPDSVPERVLALARDVTANASTPYDRALAIQSYLREIPYTLDVAAPPRGRDVADYFLFDLKKGYCDYYATAMVVMARAGGLPARFVTGYASGSYDLERARYVITEADAHSWAEVYFPDLGWVEFEPTASLPAVIRAEEGEIAPSVPTAESQGVSQAFSMFWRNLLSSAWPYAAFAILLTLVWIGTDSMRLSRLAPTEAIRRIHQRLHRLARPISGATSIDQTAHEYASALIARLNMLASYKWLAGSEIEINTLTEVYARSLFAPSMPARAEIRGAIKVWSRLRLRLSLANILMIWNRGVRSRLK